jgi:hypothetical protein
MLASVLRPSVSQVRSFLSRDTPPDAIPEKLPPQLNAQAYPLPAIKFGGTVKGRSRADGCSA